MNLCERGPAWLSRLLLVVLSLLIAFGLVAGEAVVTVAADDGGQAMAEVIVVLEPGVDPVAAAQEMGVNVTHIYRHVFSGFSGLIPQSSVAAARTNRGVRSISPDGQVQAEAQIMPTGVSRVGTPIQPGTPHLALPSPVDADIAILDTGIARNSDLNVIGGKACVKGKGKKDKEQGKNKKKHKKHKKHKKKGKLWEDNNGHGTHTSGIAAAFDNDKGVVGVAAGARLWAVKVLDSRGSGSFSDVVCGLDFVYAKSQTIDIVNMSLSGDGSDSACADTPLHQAICNVVDAGVPVIVAAGNEGTNTSTRVPAAFDQVITVSGMADTDGQPGHLGPQSCSNQPDDTFLVFSNFGADVDIAAPGDCITSTWFKGKLQTFSGTSESTPHVTGGAAQFITRYVQQNGFRPTPDQVRAWLLTTASQPQNSSFGFTGDPDGIPEPILWLQPLASP